jgi:hypothetical protein
MRYIILDGARLEESIEEAKMINSNYDSLYQGDSKENLSAVAPYVFILANDLSFENWYLKNGWGNDCGIVFESAYKSVEIKNHLRKFLIVKTEDNQELYFRFYDPRVLKIFLPTCDKSQILEFFGPIESFICEGDTKEEAIRFWQENGELKQEVLPVEKIFGNIVANNTEQL